MSIGFGRSVLECTRMIGSQEVSAEYQGFSALGEKGGLRIAMGEGRW